MNFRKLISNLPFNPSLVGQVAFYAKRAKQESSLRRTGFAFVAFAMVIQMIAVISPPQRSMAASPDHILDGISSRQDILAAWDRPGSDIPAIYGKFGVTRANMAALTLTPNVTIRSNSGPDYWTTGRNSLSNYSTVNGAYKNTEVALQVQNETIYMRQLKAWDIKNPYNLYPAWQGTKADGTIFWVFKDCGNYTQVGKYTPKQPGLEINKTINGPTSVHPGDTVSFHIEYRNSVPDSLAENVEISDQLDLTHYDIVSPTNLNISNGQMKYPVGNLAYTQNYNVLDIAVRLKNPYPDSTTQSCNVAGIVGSNFTPALTSTPPACFNVITPCPYNAAVPIGDASCRPPVPPPTHPPLVLCKYDSSFTADSPYCVPPKLLCSLLDTDLDKDTRTASFKTEVSSTDEKATKIISYAYDFGDGKKVTQANAGYNDLIKHVYAAGTFNANVIVSYTVNGDSAHTVQTVTCADKINFETDKPLGESKTVKNITQNLSGAAANGSTVHAGDVLEYTLVTSNSQDYSRKDVVVSDYVGDILDYGDIDMAFLQTQGGTYDGATKKVNWTNITLAAKTDISKSFRVNIKNPIPSTNAPGAADGTNDCNISNKYGNEINMKVQCPVVKGIESLPNTGPGTSVIFGFAVTMVVGYFFARSRLLARELELIKNEYAPTGGIA